MTASDPVPATGASVASEPGVLSTLPLLQLMSPEVRALVERSFVEHSYPFGTEIIREGDEADGLYVLSSGRARVVQRGAGGEEVPLGFLGPGDSFGETALLEGGRRNATVRASSDVTVLRLDASVFHALTGHNPRIREAFELDRRRRRLATFLRRSSAFAALSAPALGDVLQHLDEVEVPRGTVVIREGDQAGEMFVVEEGRLRAYRRRNGATEDVGFVRSGDVVGEAAMLRGTARQATVEALTDCRLLRLSRDAFETLAREHEELRVRVEAGLARYGDRISARVPLDFAGEVMAPELAAQGAVGVDVSETPEEPAAEEAQLEDEGVDGSVERRARFRRFPLVWQIDEMDCGAACLGMITRHFGRSVSLGYIRELVGTSVDGTSLLGIVEGARALGLAARSVKASKSRLDRLPLPAVVHWEGIHWVVLYDVGDRHVRVADPGRGLRRLPREEFLQHWTGFAALLAPTAELQSAPEGRSGIAWVWRFLRPHRGTLVRAALLSIVAAMAGMLIPVLGQVMIDRAVRGASLGFINVLALGMLGVLIVMVAATVLQRYLLSRRAVQIDSESLDHVSSKLLSLPLRYFQTRRDSDLARRLSGMRSAREFLVQQGITAITAAAQVLVAVALMLVYSWQLTLVFLATVPLYALLVRFSIRRLRPIYDGMEEAFAKHHSQQLDAVRGIESVKTLGAEEALRSELRQRFDLLAHRIFRADLWVTLYEGAIQLVTFVTLGLFLWVGTRQVVQGQLTVGELVSFNALVLLANAPIAFLLSLADNFQQAYVLLNRVNDVFEHEPEQPDDRLGLVPVTTLQGRVSLQGLGFSYPGPRPQPVLEGLTLDVPPGTTVALVGRSGSGKTTLARCLAGLLEPTEGSITYDGVDLTRLDYRTLRQRIGFVLQESYLFDDTIARNIAMGEREADMERVAWAAGVAGADEFIARLPLGYDTRVGESGIKVSGGQKQRIAIARAIYRRPPVLILDEATSSLDSESERLVQDNMARLLEGRTSFVIAHRLSTIRNADLIVVLDRGRIVEQGPHDELMEARGLYYYLVSQQLDLD
jgi:HlyB family type I secretion system ABC transporter